MESNAAYWILISKIVKKICTIVQSGVFSVHKPGFLMPNHILANDQWSWSFLIVQSSYVIDYRICYVVIHSLDVSLEKGLVKTEVKAKTGA